jgi:regulator of nucleoside diphosphate kinase
MHAFPILSDLDAARIRALGEHGLADLVNGEAWIVPRERMPADVVTLNSVVSFRDELTGTDHRVTVVCPGNTSIPDRRISILSPVGRALLGRRVGSRAIFNTPTGERREIRILELHYQPEAAGDELR